MKKTFSESNNWKKNNKPRKKAVQDLVDFNNFIRNGVVEHSQTTVIDDEQKRKR